MSGFTMAEIMRDDSEGRTGYAAAGVDGRAQVMASLRRNWSRHFELRAEHGGSFERYMRSETYRFS